MAPRGLSATSRDNMMQCLQKCTLANIAKILGDPREQSETFLYQTQGPVSFRECQDQHTQNEHSEKPPGKFQCSYCPYSTDHCGNIVKHERTHTGEWPFVCQLCQKGFNSESALRRHQRARHDKEKPHECEVCGLCFDDAVNLDQHRRNVHKRDSLWLPCPQCDKVFAARYYLKCHLRTHTGERPYSCTTCGARFTGLHSMKRHKMVVHDGQYPHHCPLCGKGQWSVKNLRGHMHKQHPGEGEGTAGEGNDE
ncbi:zinc finger protein 711-like [Haemaphysalis longicornis]